jgi:hypothetical protein
MKRKRARGLVLFNKQTVKDFERLFMKNLERKVEAETFWLKTPDSWKSGKIF